MRQTVCSWVEGRGGLHWPCMESIGLALKVAGVGGLCGLAFGCSCYPCDGAGDAGSTRTGKGGLAWREDDIAPRRHQQTVKSKGVRLACLWLCVGHVELLCA